MGWVGEMGELRDMMGWVGREEDGREKSAPGRGAGERRFRREGWRANLVVLGGG